MLKPILGAFILVASIPTVGYLAAGQICFLMGFANIPGYRLYRAGVEQQRNALQLAGVFLGWLGQSLVSLAFAFLLVQLVRLFFTHFEFHAIFRWPFWFAMFLLALAPAYKTRSISEQSSPEMERLYFRVTLSLTGLTTAVGFIAFGVTHFSFL